MSKRTSANHGSSSMPAIHDTRRSGAEETGFQKFMREQIWAADKVAGNMNIVIGVGFFAASIMATRLWGHMLLVPGAA